MSPVTTPLPTAAAHSPELLAALGWYAREVIGIERLFREVTVKRRRNPARPVRRRRSAFRDPMICYDFLAMAWLGATRLSQIEPHLRHRDDCAAALGLPRFCDHTTAHNFLNAFHVAHLRQLDAVNARLLREHGSALTQRAPILDLELAERLVRRPGRRNRLHHWAVAFCAGEAVAQELSLRSTPPHALVAETVARARLALDRKPHLVRLAGLAASDELLPALWRLRLPFLTTVPWSWALAHHPRPARTPDWAPLDDASRVLDLGAAAPPRAPRRRLRALLVERPASAPGAGRQRLAILTSLADDAAPILVRLAASMTRLRTFFGHASWPLRDGKPPSSDPRGNAAYLRLAAIAMNILRLFARQLGADVTPARLHALLRVTPWRGT
ncbi:MAG TPA: hypothetical protein VNE39_25900 [Planctomycetota bacterium]|nr:hypothetical protein [Planctomycetota bacterium]